MTNIVDKLIKPVNQIEPNNYFTDLTKIKIGGYYSKYLKYKTKYLRLKKNDN